MDNEGFIMNEQIFDFMSKTASIIFSDGLTLLYLSFLSYKKSDNETKEFAKHIQNIVCDRIIEIQQDTHFENFEQGKYLHMGDDTRYIFSKFVNFMKDYNYINEK